MDAHVFFVSPYSIHIRTTLRSPKNQLEQTPLHVAASCGNRDAVSVLLELDADPEAEDRKGRCPGQTWLRQVSQRARADIRKSLEAAVARHAAGPAPSDSDSDDGDDECDSTCESSSSLGFGMEESQHGQHGGGATVQPSHRGTSSTVSTKNLSFSSEDVAPVTRHSVLNLLPSTWGLGKKVGGEGDRQGGMLFGTPVAAVR